MSEAIQPSRNLEMYDEARKAATAVAARNADRANPDGQELALEADFKTLQNLTQQLTYEVLGPGVSVPPAEKNDTPEDDDSKHAAFLEENGASKESVGKLLQNKETDKEGFVYVMKELQFLKDNEGIVLTLEGTETMEQLYALLAALRLKIAERRALERERAAEKTLEMKPAPEPKKPVMELSAKEVKEPQNSQAKVHALAAGPALETAPAPTMRRQWRPQQSDVRRTLTVDPRELKPFDFKQYQAKLLPHLEGGMSMPPRPAQGPKRKKEADAALTL